MKRLERVLALSCQLDTCYSSCIDYANDITFDISNRTEIQIKSIDFFNDTINKYNEQVNYIEEITNNSKIIGLDFSKLQEMFENYESTISNLKSAYDKLYLYDSTKNKIYLNEAESFWRKSYDISAKADAIRKDYFFKASDYVQNYLTK